MLQIKTITYRLGDAKEFDDAVNAAIAEGWTLTKRDVLRPLAQPSVSSGNYFYTMLYAELEKGREAEKKPDPVASEVHVRVHPPKKGVIFCHNCNFVADPGKPLPDVCPNCHSKAQEV